MVFGFENTQNKQICKFGEDRSECVSVRSHLFFKLNLNPPSFHLILITTQHRLFSPFNEMFQSSHLPSPSLSLRCYLRLSFPPSSHRPSFPPLIVFGFLSVILLGKVIKGQHIEGALLHCVILFSGAHLFVCYFCLQQQTLSGGGGEGGLGGR